MTLPYKPNSIGQTNVTYIQSRDILTKTSGFLDTYDFTLNPYSGCSFGCSYCYAAFFSRDTEKINSWGYWLNVKENAVELMRKRKPGSLNQKLIYMSSVTDPYQPIEKRLSLTRQILEVLSDHHAPKLVVQTRGPLVVNDIDLYHKIERKGGRVQVNMTITTDDESIRKAFEPLCPSNAQRIKAITEIQEGGIDACITMTPLLLVQDNNKFIYDLMETGVEKFVTQPFHWGSSSRFVAGTREGAMDILSEKLQCEKRRIVPEYQQRYRKFVAQLKSILMTNGLPPAGEGKSGFAPPF